MKFVFESFFDHFPVCSKMTHSLSTINCKTVELRGIERNQFVSLSTQVEAVRRIVGGCTALQWTRQSRPPDSQQQTAWWRYTWIFHEPKFNVGFCVLWHCLPVQILRPVRLSSCAIGYGWHQHISLGRFRAGFRERRGECIESEKLHLRGSYLAWFDGESDFRLERCRPELIWNFISASGLYTHSNANKVMFIKLDKAVEI